MSEVDDNRPDQPAKFSGRNLFPNTQELGPEDRNYRESVALHFVFADHLTPQHGAAVADAFQNDDIIALEKVGGTREIRSAYEWNINLYMEMANDPDREQEAQTFLESLGGSEFENAMFSRLAAQGKKKIVILDISEDDTDAWALNLEADEASADISKRLLSGHHDNEQLRQLLTINMILDARRDLARERVTRNQLDELAKEVSASTPASSRRIKIGVMAGSTHTGIQHIMDKVGFQTSRDFLDSGPERSTGQKVHFSPEEQATRDLKLRKADLPKESLLNRILLSRYYRLLTLPTGQPIEAVIELDRDNEALLANMRDDKVAEVLDSLGQVQGTKTTEILAEERAILEASKQRQRNPTDSQD